MSRLAHLARVPYLLRCNSKAQKIQIVWKGNTTKYTDKQSKINKTAKEPTVPDNTSLYKVPEYFQYTEFSYYDFEAEMVPKRMPQPSPYD